MTNTQLVDRTKKGCRRVQWLASFCPLIPAVLAVSGTVFAQTPFVIASVSSGMVLDLPDSSPTAGTLIQQWPAHGGANQRWTLRRAPGASAGHYEIVSVSSGMVLDVPGLSTTPGTNIQQWSANGGCNQQWTIGRSAGATGYEIVSCGYYSPPGAGFLTEYPLVLDVPDFSTTQGTKIQQWTENGGTNQQWLFYPQATGNITVTGSGRGYGTIQITGWGFAANTVVCPFLSSAGTGQCATVLANGTFSTTAFTGNVRFYYTSSGPNYVVATIEDHNGNVLAIGSVPGQFGSNPE